MHEPIGTTVSSYFIAPAGVVIDPKVPAEGFEALPAAPSQVVLTSGHHLRDAPAFAEHFSIPIRASVPAADHIGDEATVQTFAAGEQVADGVTGVHIGVLCPDEGALLIAHGGGALAIADGVTPRHGSLGFFSDALLGDDPPAIKRGLKQAYAALLDREFAHLLFAHGTPVLDTGRSDLEAFVSGSAGE